MRQLQAPLMSLDDPLQVRHHFPAPPQQVRAIDLKLHRRKRWHPRDPAIAHLRKLLASDEESMLDSVHTAFDGVLNAIRSRGMGERLSPMCPRRLHQSFHFLDRHLRRHRHLPALKLMIR
jgi:hypothetical protein